MVQPDRPSERGPLLPTDLLYVVEPSGRAGGMLRRVRQCQPDSSGAASGGALCYRALFDRAMPCPHCPIAVVASTGQRQEWVVPDPGAAMGLGLFVARPAGPEDAGAVEVAYRFFPDELVRNLFRARLVALGDRARLSPRERAVLEFVVMGRTAGDIAVVLEITPRTVQFHQTNLWRKLGVDSRTDLLRLLL